MQIVMNMSDYIVEKISSPESTRNCDLTSEEKKGVLELAILHFEEQLPTLNTALPPNMAAVDVELFLQKMQFCG